MERLPKIVSHGEKSGVQDWINPDNPDKQKNNKACGPLWQAQAYANRPEKQRKLGRRNLLFRSCGRLETLINFV
jgi:hypothetical protein